MPDDVVRFSAKFSPGIVAYSLEDTVSKKNVPFLVGSGEEDFFNSERNFRIYGR